MKPAIDSAAALRESPPTEQVILFSIGAHLFAIAAESVAEIRSTDSLAGPAVDFALATLPKVRHTFRRGKALYYAVVGSAHFYLPATHPTLAFIMRESRAAVLVDAIERMAAITKLQALPEAFCGEERQWYRGLTLIDDRVVPVVDPAGFLSANEIATLDRELASSDRRDRGAKDSGAA